MDVTKHLKSLLERSDTMDVIERIKAYRIANKLSHAKMAEKLKVSRVCYIRWETGKARPNATNRQYLELFLDQNK